jgi:hypothetical protein
LRSAYIVDAMIETFAQHGKPAELCPHVGNDNPYPYGSLLSQFSFDTIPKIPLINAPSKRLIATAVSSGTGLNIIERFPPIFHHPGMSLLANAYAFSGIIQYLFCAIDGRIRDFTFGPRLERHNQIVREGLSNANLTI